MFLLLLNFLLCFYGHVLAQETFPQRCEGRPVATQENFNMTRFLGVWYDTNHIAESLVKCPIINLKRIGDGQVTIEHLEYGVNNEMVLLEKGTVSFGTRQNESMVLTDQSSANASLEVAGTDYDGYAVLWLCLNSKGNESQSQQQLWIWARNYSLSATVLAAINSTIATNNLTDFRDVSNLEGQIQCRFISMGNDTIAPPALSNNATAMAPHNATVVGNETMHNHTTTHSGTQTRGPNCEFTTTAMIIITVLLSALFNQA